MALVANFFSFITQLGTFDIFNVFFQHPHCSQPPFHHFSLRFPSSYPFFIVYCHLWHCSCVFSPLISTLIGFAWTKMYHQSNYLLRTFKYETFGRSTSHVRSFFQDFGVITSVGRFLNHHPVFDLVFTMKMGWHNYMWEPDWKSTSNFHMNENRSWKPILIF